MKSTLLTILMSALMSAVAVAGDLTWQVLAGRPELWPAQVTVRVAMKFQGGVAVQPGQKANVVQVKADEIDLITTDGKTNFAADPNETDALAVAGAAYAKLTPKQRELTYASIAQRKDLWPAHVAMTRAFQLGGGQSVNAGDQVVVKNVQPDRVLALVERLNTTFEVTPPATDIMAQARRFVEDAQAGPRLVAMQRQAEEKIAAEQKALGDKIKAEGRVVAELEGKLINSQTGQPEPLDTKSLPRYLVFLRGQSSCPITRRFAPTFIKYCAEMKPKHPEFEVIYLTVEDMPETEKFAKELGFNWRTVTYENTTMPSVSPSIEGRIPQLLVMDRNGRILANGVQNDAPAALKQLDALLKQPATQ